MDEIYEKNHKFPRGLKKKLALHYGTYRNGHCGCVLCWSFNRVAIHHHCHWRRNIDTLDTHFRYRIDDEGKTDFTQLNNFVLLCASCHGKVHMMEAWTQSDKPPPLLDCLYDIIEKHNPELKLSKAES